MALRLSSWNFGGISLADQDAEAVDGTPDLIAMDVFQPQVANRPAGSIRSSGTPIHISPVQSVIRSPACTSVNQRFKTICAVRPGVPQRRTRLNSVVRKVAVPNLESHCVRPIVGNLRPVELGFSTYKLIPSPKLLLGWLCRSLLLAAGRHDVLQPHIRDQVSVMLQVMHVVDRQRAQPR